MLKEDLDCTNKIEKYFVRQNKKAKKTKMDLDSNVHLSEKQFNEIQKKGFKKKYKNPNEIDFNPSDLIHRTCKYKLTNF